MKLRNAPPRLVTGAYILHTGLEKWKGDEQTAGFIHGSASNAFPILKPIPPQKFLKLLAGSEIALGSALLIPFVPRKMAGTALSLFASALLAMYARTPALRKPGSIWPSQQGIGIAKDSWMLGIGLSLLADARADEHAEEAQERKAA